MHRSVNTGKKNARIRPMRIVRPWPPLVMIQNGNHRVGGPHEKLKIHQISVYTNLEVQLKARTTREEANKEVDRIMGADNLFEGYDWKIDGCWITLLCQRLHGSSTIVIKRKSKKPRCFVECLSYETGTIYKYTQNEDKICN